VSSDGKALSTADADDIRYEVHGQGAPIVWAGGWNPVAYETLQARFPKTVNERSVVTFAYRGGKGSGSTDTAHATWLYAADVLRVLDRAGLGRVDLVGIGGMGALVMMQLAIGAPDRINSAILAQGNLRADIRARWVTAALESLRRDTGYQAYQKLVLAISHSPEYLDAHGDALLGREWTELSDEESAAQHYGFIRACMEHDVTDTIHRLIAPTLVVSGDEADPVTGPNLARTLTAALPNSELVIVPEMPHAYWESPVFLAALDDAMHGHHSKNPLRVTE
jgi:pimeloyl-ACP methyl ester carboxylesterase